ncbi:MAG: hypothetical protein MJB14_06070 [Spirochaetes bacterium]|nr:hypothetical protein [Spirochaetota bacterium]
MNNKRKLLQKLLELHNKNNEAVYEFDNDISKLLENMIVLKLINAEVFKFEIIENLENKKHQYENKCFYYSYDYPLTQSGLQYLEKSWYDRFISSITWRIIKDLFKIIVSLLSIALTIKYILF